MSRRIKTIPTPAVEPPARFEFWSDEAREVCIAGSFNEWHPAATPMIQLGAGYWVKELTLPPDRHEYLFVVDGQWLPDPDAEFAVPNPFGGWNSVREVAAGVPPAVRVAATSRAATSNRERRDDELRCNQS